MQLATLRWLRAAVNADVPNSSVRKSGVLKISEVLEGRWQMLVR